MDPSIQPQQGPLSTTSVLATDSGLDAALEKGLLNETALSSRLLNGTALSNGLLNGTTLPKRLLNETTLSNNFFNDTAFSDELLNEAAFPSGLLSDEVRTSFGLIVGYWVVFFLSALGLVTNSLTMIVFLRQGFRESVNVSLFSIAVWDQIKCMAGVIFRLHGPIGLVNPVWGVIWENGSRTYLVYLPIFAGYVSYGLATYLSIERCLNISMPFKVRLLFSPRLTLGIMVIISALIFTSFSPMFFIYNLEFTYSAYYNASIIIRTPGALYYAYDGVILKMYKFLGIFYPAIFCTIMVVTSVIIVYHLKKSAANFKKSSQDKIEASKSSSASGEITSRDARVTKMLLVVIFVYLMDFFPRLCKYTASLIEPEFFAYRRYHNLMLAMSNIIWVLDFVNASVNFSIFMAMSSSFKKTYHDIISKKT